MALLCWDRFLLCSLLRRFFEIINGCWILSKAFFCIYWHYCMVSIFKFVNMVYHIDSFAYIKESLKPWNKPNLIMVYEIFNVLSNSVCSNFVEDFCIYVYQWYWPVICFFCAVFAWFWYQGDSGLVEEFRSVPSSAIFWKSFRRKGISSSLNAW